MLNIKTIICKTRLFNTIEHFFPIITEKASLDDEESSQNPIGSKSNIKTIICKTIQGRRHKITSV